VCDCVCVHTPVHACAVCMLCTGVCVGLCVVIWAYTEGCACVCAGMSCAHMHGCAYVVVHWGMHACAHVCICGYVCVVKEKQQEVFQILVLYTRASPSRPRGCSDPHLHCSGPLTSNGSLNKHRLSATPWKWPEEEVKFPSFKETC